ncbi:MAG: hypothetical protein IH987_18845, partial [Planctomycetes bacterium]|nr:hypothetical protein [Planctomycetota bacterium]
MNRHVRRGWRPLFGALTIGVVAFGLSLQGAPAEDGTDLLVNSGAESVGAAATTSNSNNAVSEEARKERQRKLAPAPGENGTGDGSEPPALEMIVEDTVMHVGRVVSGTRVATKGGEASTSRAAGSLLLGDPCSCDEDCAPAGDDCNLTQCILRSFCTDDPAVPCSSDNDCERAGAGTCTDEIDNCESHDPPDCNFVQRCDTVQLIGWPCDADADFCTADLCADDGLGSGTSICVAQDDGAGGTLSACAKHCVLGPANGLRCGQASDCAQGSCQIIPNGGCDSAAEACYVGASLGTAIGRCCSDDPEPACTETDEASCAGEWYRYRSPEHQAGDGFCICPKYGSGVSPPGVDSGSVGLVRPSGLVCEVGSEISVANGGAPVYCEVALGTSFCQKRCLGGDRDGDPCNVDNPDCAGLGTCNDDGVTFCIVGNEGSDCPDPENDTCVPFDPGVCTDDPCVPNCIEGDCGGDPPVVGACEDGFLSIGDDFATSNGGYLRVTEFRFRGGITNLGEDFVIEFWSDDGSQLIDAFLVPNLGRTGTYDWTIEVDCWPNCNAQQNEVPEQNPIIIPPTGNVV